MVNRTIGSNVKFVNRYKKFIIRFNFRISVALALIFFAGHGISFILSKQDLADILIYISLCFLIIAMVSLVINHLRKFDS